jgi:hypothetical protein
VPGQNYNQTAVGLFIAKDKRQVEVFKKRCFYNVVALCLNAKIGLIVLRVQCASLALAFLN